MSHGICRDEELLHFTSLAINSNLAFFAIAFVTMSHRQESGTKRGASLLVILCLIFTLRSPLLVDDKIFLPADSPVLCMHVQLLVSGRGMVETWGLP